MIFNLKRYESYVNNFRSYKNKKRERENIFTLTEYNHFGLDRFFIHLWIHIHTHNGKLDDKLNLCKTAPIAASLNRVGNPGENGGAKNMSQSGPGFIILTMWRKMTPLGD